jgi:hypothetical protein
MTNLETAARESLVFNAVSIQYKIGSGVTSAETIQHFKPPIKVVEYSAYAKALKRIEELDRISKLLEDALSDLTETVCSEDGLELSVDFELNDTSAIGNAMGILAEVQKLRET